MNDKEKFKLIREKISETRISDLDSLRDSNLKNALVTCFKEVNENGGISMGKAVPGDADHINVMYTKHING